MKPRRRAWRIPGGSIKQPTEGRPVLVVPLGVVLDAGVRVVLAAYQLAGTVVCTHSPGGLAVLDVAPQTR